MALSHSVNTLFKPNEIIRALSLADKANEKIAVYPKNLEDQFQFAARLTKPVIALHTLSDLQAWSNNNPSGYCLIFESKKNLCQFSKEPQAIPYKDKWLLFGKVESSSDVRLKSGTTPPWHYLFFEVLFFKKSIVKIFHS